ncbi:unnamed protein product [Polarella glacialis]|uniref:Uncharacterized protein n=1 Tax=Polarella glacialis TaxID=89957 RepID=A0A813DWB4_POLGL|nr:unnamed protein product [Polarella glacialis]
MYKEIRNLNINGAIGQLYQELLLLLLLLLLFLVLFLFLFLFLLLLLLLFLLLLFLFLFLLLFLFLFLFLVPGDGWTPPCERGFHPDHPRHDGAGRAVPWFCLRFFVICYLFVVFCCSYLLFVFFHVDSIFTP